MCNTSLTNLQFLASKIANSLVFIIWNWYNDHVYWVIMTGEAYARLFAKSDPGVGY